MSDIIIYGRGKTGQSLYDLVVKQGRQAVFYDDKVGFDGEGAFSPNSLVLLSPGVKPYASGIEKAKKAGSTVLSELEYCFPLCKGRVVSVTGTNGKTTTCEMIHAILRQYGIRCRLLGNGGVPFSSQASQVEYDEIVVLESSSFQLYKAEKFAPYISVYTSLADDHLDYHVDVEDYVDAKSNNFIRQRDGFAVFNGDDLRVVEQSKRCSCRKYFYSLDNALSACRIAEKKIVVSVDGITQSVDEGKIEHFARHNKSNALAAITVCALLGVPLCKSVAILQDYSPLPHRLQSIGIIDNVTFVDDSKATNVHATLSAIKNYSENLALVLGGSDKNENFDALFSEMGSNVKVVTASGDTAAKIYKSGKKYGYRVVVFDDIAQATSYCYARLLNIGGGVVLMSNACASFDKFDGYEARGDYFRRTVEVIRDSKKKN